jgi:hypothetical protein
MANKVSGVVLSITVKGPPGTNIIRLEDVLVDGKGELTEEIFGGTSKFGLTLDKGKAEEVLTLHELVSVQGIDSDGAKFTLPGQLQITHTKKPWQLGSP